MEPRAELVRQHLRLATNPSAKYDSNMMLCKQEVMLKPIKPNIIRHGPERCRVTGERFPALRTEELPSELAPASLVPKLSRSDYYSTPSVDPGQEVLKRFSFAKEAMSRMTEAQLSRVDNLEVGRYGFGAVKWPGRARVQPY